MQQNRTTISSLMVLVAMAAVFFALVGESGSPYAGSRICAIVYLSLWVYWPIRLYRNHWQAASATYRRFDPDEPGLSPLLRGEIRGIAAELARLGFVLREIYAAEGHVSRATGLIALFENRSTLDVAKWLWVGVGSRESSSFVFSSELPDGTEVVTGNSRVARITPPSPPEIKGMAFPRIRDPRRLYAIHCARVGDRARREAIGDDPLGYQHRIRNRSISRMVERGYLRLVENEGLYRPTWKGAILMAWRLIWPVGPIRRLWRWIRSEIVLLRLGVDRRASVAEDEAEVAPGPRW